MRPKTIRRLVLLLVVLAVLVGTGYGFYAHNQRKKFREMTALRDAGLAAYEAHDYDAAAESLRPFVASRGTADFEAALALSVSELRSPRGEPQLRDVRQRLTELARDHGETPELRTALLEVLGRTGGHAQAVELAERMLDVDPADAEALAALRDNHRLAGNDAAALDAAKRYNTQRPFDIHGHVATLRLMDAFGHSSEDLLARARGLAEAHPNDPRFDLLLAVAHNFRGDHDAALAALRAAAERPAPDADFVRLTAALLDEAKQFSEAQALLERAAAEASDDQGGELTALLARRFWQNERFDAMLDLLRGVEVSDPDVPAEVVALRALACHEVGDDAAAEVDMVHLAARAADPVARAWHEALTARFDDTLTPRQEIDALQDALLRHDDAAFAFWEGQTYEAIGEDEMALRLFELAAERARSWDRPYLAISRIQLRLGRLGRALSAAEDARRRAHDDTAAWVQIAEIRRRLWEQTPTARTRDTLLATVRGIQQNHPDEPGTLPMLADLLRADGQVEAARELIARQLGRDDLPAAALLELAEVSRRGEMGLGAALLDGRDDPSVVLHRARRLATAGDVTGGRALLEASIETHVAGDDVIERRVNLARFNEQFGDPADPTMAAEWSALGDAYPDDATVQRSILTSPAAATDAELTRRTIDRLREVTGDAGLQWRLARARFLLSGQAGDDPAHTETALSLLREVGRVARDAVEPRVLIARALERSGNPRQAVAHLREAFNLDPRNAASAGLELVRLRRELEQFDEARADAVHVAENAALDPAQRLALARSLTALGEPDRAVALLQDTEAMGRLTLEGRLLLAALLERRGNTEAARRLYEAMAEAGDAPPAVLLAAARSYGRAGDEAAARDTIDRLTGNDVPAILARAAFAAEFDTPEMTRGLLDAANRAAGTDPAMHAEVDRQRAAYELAVGNPEAALRVAETHAGEAAFDRLAAEARLLMGAGGDDLGRTLDALEAELAGRPDAAAWGEALAVLRQARRTDADGNQTLPAEALVELDAVADEHLRLLPLQAWVVRLHAAAGNDQAAADRAARVFDAMPTRPEAAKLAATAALRAGRWSAARRAAAVWAKRGVDGPVPPATVAADAHLRAGDPVAAVAALRPVLETAAAQPQAHARALVVAAEALAQTGDTRAAWSLVRPRLDGPDATRWRALALGIGALAVQGEADARAWLEGVEATLPDDAAEIDRRDAAFAWWRLAMREPTAEAVAAATQRLEALGGDVESLGRLADLQARIGRPRDAEATYREALRLRPDHGVSLNNLAFLLLQRADAAEGEERDALLDQAARLSTRALAASPTSPSYLDTSARVKLAAGRPAEAEQDFRAALAGDPSYVDALLGLASVKSAAGDRAEASRLLEQVLPLVDGRPLPGHLQRELDDLRGTTAATSTD